VQVDGKVALDKGENCESGAKAQAPKWTKAPVCRRVSPLPPEDPHENRHMVKIGIDF
jgi:hypothetical protein